MPTALAPFQIMPEGYIGLFGRYGIESGWPFSGNGRRLEAWHLKFAPVGTGCDPGFYSH